MAWFEVFLSFQAGATCLLCGPALETSLLSSSTLRHFSGPVLAWLAPSFPGLLS